MTGTQPTQVRIPEELKRKAAHVARQTGLRTISALVIKQLTDVVNTYEREHGAIKP